jgi:hypothetical protein
MGCGDDDAKIAEAFNPIHESPDVELTGVTDTSVTYAFSGDQPPLAVGDVIASAQGNGFLRKITAVSSSGNTLIVSTAQARLTDAVEEGSFSDSVALNVGDAVNAEAGGRRLVATKMLRGAAVVGNAIQLNNVVLYSANGLTVRIPRGHISFSAGLDIGAKLRWFKVQEFHAIASGSLDTDIDLEATAQLSLTREKEVAVATFTSVALQFIGPVPVIEVITLEFLVGARAEMTGAMTATTGIDGSAAVTFGAEYVRDNGWDGIGDRSFNMSADTPTFSGSAGVTLRGYVKPQITVAFYGLAGPYLAAEPYVEFDADLAVGPSIDWRVVAGIDAILGFNVSALGYDIFDYNHAFNLYNRELASGHFGMTYNLAGTWKFLWYDTPSVGTHTLALTQTGSRIAGTLGANAVSGSIVNRTVTFVQSGPTTYTFTGTISPGSSSMSGTWDDGAGVDNWSATKR